MDIRGFMDIQHKKKKKTAVSCFICGVSSTNLGTYRKMVKMGVFWGFTLPVVYMGRGARGDKLPYLLTCCNIA